MLRWKVALVGGALLCLSGCATAQPMAPIPPSTTVQTTGAIIPAATPTGARAFDRAQAATLVSEGIERAMECRTIDGPTGSGYAVLVFAPDGTVTDVEVDEPFDGTDVGLCIENELKNLAVRPFEGGPLRVGKKFEIAPQG